MANVHHLQNKLKALKLGGMLDTLDLRLGQAHQEHLGYIEFLELPLEDEVQRRANKSLAARVANARFEEEFSLQQAEDIYELIDERTHSGSLVVASNRPPQDWYPLFPNPVLAEGILDRLVNRAHQVVLTGRSYRPMLRPDRRNPVDQKAGTM